jgi:hypothetical protein
MIEILKALVKQTIGMVKPTVLAFGLVEVIKQKVLISTSVEFSLEELNDYTDRSSEAPKS